MKPIINFRTNVSSRWEVHGPGGGGTMFFPIVSPHDPDTIMTTCDMTGTYISHNKGDTWEFLNIKARVDSLAFDYKTRGIIYAGSTGLFRSTDNGDEWNLVFPHPDKITGETFTGDEAMHCFITEDNWPGTKVQMIAVDPDNSNHIYIGIGRTKSIRYEAEELFVFSSKNFGETWTDLGLVKGSSFRKIYVDPFSDKNNRHVYIFTDRSFYLLKSADLAITEMPLPQRVGDRCNNDGIFLKPPSHNYYWDRHIVNIACSINKVSGRNNFFLLTNQRIKEGKLQTGVLRSEDNGATWKELDGGLSDSFEGHEDGNVRWFSDITTPVVDCSTIYISIWRLPSEISKRKGIKNYYGIMKSVDFGETWKWCLKYDRDFPSNMITGWQEERYDTDWMSPPVHIAVSNTNPEFCFYTNMGSAFKTEDGGNSWQQCYCTKYEDGTTTGNNLEVTNCYGIHFDPYDKDHYILTYTDIGMLHSYNGGITWKSAIEGVPFEWTITSYWMVFDPDVKGRSWSVWSHCHDLPREKIFRNNSFEKYPYTGGVCRSENGVASWEVSSKGLPEKCIATHIIMDPNSKPGNRTLYITSSGKGVYKSTDDGYSWVQKNNGLGDNLYSWRFVQLPDGTLFLINMRVLKDNKTFAGSLFKSTDGAESWEQITMPVYADAPVNLDFDINNPLIMYLSCWPDNEDKPQRGGGLYRTEDGGKTWKNVFDTNAYVYGITVHRDNPSILYIATFQNSAYKSFNSGLTWSRIEGYDFKWGNNIIHDIYDKDKIYITTFGGSLWHGPDPKN